MLSINRNSDATQLLATPGKKNDEVDKRSNRSTPGNSEGARPPQKEDYEKLQDKEEEPQGETVDNEEKDKNQD